MTVDLSQFKLSSYERVQINLPKEPEDSGVDERYALENLKYVRCVDALIERLEGEIAQEILDDGVASLRARNDKLIASSGLSRAAYLEDEGLSEKSYEIKLKDEARREVALSIVLDKMIEASGTLVSNNEITEYLACDDPQTFVAELIEQGTVEQARTAAARVKVMRRIMDAADIVEAPQ